MNNLLVVDYNDLSHEELTVFFELLQFRMLSRHFERKVNKQFKIGKDL